MIERKLKKAEESTIQALAAERQRLVDLVNEASAAIDEYAALLCRDKGMDLPEGASLQFERRDDGVYLVPIQELPVPADPMQTGEGSGG